MDDGETDYVGLLNEYAQKNGWSVHFHPVHTGTEPINTFTMRVAMNNKVYPEGVGRNKEEAMQNAAENALSFLENDAEKMETNSDSSASFLPETKAKLINGVKKLFENVSNYKEEALASLVGDKKNEPVGQVLDEYRGWEDKLSVLNYNLFACSRSLCLVKQNKSSDGSEVLDYDLSSQIKQISSGSQSQEPSFMSESADYSSFPSETSNINEHEILSEEDKTVSNYSTKSRFLEDFDSITKIGGGGFGRVFKARRKLEDKYFAVKVVKFNEKACREVFALSRLEHANIVRYHTAWTEETAYRFESSDSNSGSSSDSALVGTEFLYIQMELCEGETLREWIDERNDHPEKYPERRQEAAEIIKQVLEAVKYIHLKKLFHRDLKPANIMFGPEKYVKVGDFGLVTEEEDEDDGYLMEHTKSAGTRSYMSPEQKEDSTYGRKVDIFSVGLIYFELLWHVRTQREKVEIWDNIRSRTFPEQFCQRFNSERKLIERMLCGNPEERPEASDILTELDKQ